MPRGAGSIFLRGSARWTRYLINRRRFDTGYLTLVFSLRQLDDDERLLAVDWGSAYANTFLLIEPLHDDVDLSAEDDPLVRGILREAQFVSNGGDTSRLMGLLRDIYASWVYWVDAPATRESYRRLAVPMARHTASLRACLQDLLPQIYPSADVRRALERLLRDEPELFRGRLVERAQSPFLTRLGLPPVYDTSTVTNALRTLVNEGRSAARPPGAALAFQGPDRPLPEDMPNELFERMLL